ncbi:MAG TPA: hypothetical protein VF173_05900, partial [Thermoanaerobaculia bacterium]|nr:hypothetical protein [Thermoanaerobaculia bacterium]
MKAVAVAVAAALVLLVWLNLARTRQAAWSLGRRQLSADFDGLPGPWRYALELQGMAPPFSAGLLDELATLLSRQTSSRDRREIDVERSVDRTLKAGLAPQIVVREQSAASMLIVLVDRSDEMRPFGWKVAALLAGLEQRGVRLERWSLDGNTGRVSRSRDLPSLTLAELAQLRPDSAMVLISTGQGFARGDRFELAEWAGLLSLWGRRAWFHPIPDPSYWRPWLRQAKIGIWPMTSAGMLAAARHLRRRDPTVPAWDHPDLVPLHRVTPLDVDRLRWLLSLAPRRDPVLGEWLRQRFFPDVPEAASVEAFAAPPLHTPVGVGPTSQEVHEALLHMLDGCRPPTGTAAHERWRLDRAVQSLYVPEAAASGLTTLAELAHGPMAGEVER